MFRRRGAILRESQRQRNTSTNTSGEYDALYFPDRCAGACILLSLGLPGLRLGAETCGSYLIPTYSLLSYCMHLLVNVVNYTTIRV